MSANHEPAVAPARSDGPVQTSSAPRTGESTLRQRKGPATTALDLGPDVEDVKKDKDNEEEEVNWGKTPGGTVFRVPQTHSFVNTLFTTLHRSSLTRWTFLSLIAQPILFVLWRNHPTLRSVFFLLYFTFWRGCYDFGFAWMLRKQSEKKWIVKSLKAWGWLDTGSESGDAEGRAWAHWWKNELEMKMGKGYKWEDCPAEFNAWLMFRQLVDIVLLNDFVSYSCFAWANLHFPANHSTLTHIFRWVFGWSLIFFNLWVKMDAHRVVKDYAWYWGDAFWLMVMQHDLVFDGVYEIAPHPMYSVGYAGYYGLSMVVGSYTVLFVSLAAHAAQFAFLLWFENPHIERTYGGAKKPLVSRSPIRWTQAQSVTDANVDQPDNETSAIIDDHHERPTPAATDGETETEPELPELPEITVVEGRKPRSDSSVSYMSTADVSAKSVPPGAKKPFPHRRARALSMHDLTHRFFRKPVVILANIDIFRATDFALVVLVMYALTTLVPALPTRAALGAHFLHALSWRLFHSYGLGLLLRAQSKTKWLVRHFLKHYHYPGEGSTAADEALVAGPGTEKEGVLKRATEEAFKNWQVGYNISLVMTYVSFAGLAWKTYHLPMDWTVSGTILRHVLGSSLIALHIWAAISTYEVLGDFGWLYADFFLIEQIPSQLAYTGIYRFLNNPEQSMGGAAFFGLWLISNSKLVFVLALVSHLSHWWFLSCVERPHMKRLYGDRLRKDGGLTKTLKNVAGKTLSSRAGKHAPEIRRVVQEVKGSIEKVEERVAGAMEGFLDHARPMFNEMVNDTKVLIQQSRERMVIPRMSSDLAAYDKSRYSLTVSTSSASPQPRYHVGQPIPISWTAPSNHSRKDWIGIYRLGSCKSDEVTRISSVGKWMPIYDDEWDGDQPVDPREPREDEGKDAGEVLFRGDQLPWLPGRYEIRYHHDGKHNVMSMVAPIEIYVNKPSDPSSYRSVRSTLLNIVTLSLDSDKSLLPASAKSAKLERSISSASASGKAIRAIAQDHPALASAGADHEDDVDLTPPSTARARTASSTTASRNKNKKTSSGGGASIKDDEHVSHDHHGEGGDILHPLPDEPDDDDFAIMTEAQAKRIVSLCEIAFGVEITTDVVVAEANVGALARRVVAARSLAQGNAGETSGGAAGT